MANQIPFTGATNAAGGFLLPPEQGEILVNGILVETGALQLAGDARATTARKTNFPIWLGRPTAGPVGEGAAKGVTGASFGQASLNIQKFASIVIFTDEQIADLQNGDLSVLADAGVRQALSVAIDAHAVGLSAGSLIAEKAEQAVGGSVFDSPLLQSAGAGILIPAATSEQEKGEKPDTRLQKAVSAALGVLEENGYGDPSDIGVLLGFGFQKVLRDARDGFGRPIYDGGSFAGQVIDPLYGLDRAHSTNLTPLSAPAQTLELEETTGSAKVKIKAAQRGAAHPLTNFPIFVGQPVSGTGIPANSVIKAIAGKTGEETEVEIGKVGPNGVIEAVNATATATNTITFARPVGLVVHKPNIHVRIRQDVILRTSNEATIENEGTKYNLFQQNLTAVLYETRLGILVHDSQRSLVPLYT
jgi:stage V sporulation protein SpoVS